MPLNSNLGAFFVFLGHKSKSGCSSAATTTLPGPEAEGAAAEGQGVLLTSLFLGPSKDRLSLAKATITLLFSPAQ